MVKKYAKEFWDRLSQSKNAVMFTGAGSSTGSGIPDFRGPDGLYSRIPPETFDIGFFMSQPDRYYRIERDVLRGAIDAKPNDSHFLIARLEKMSMIQGVITQNIDGLHQKAGSENVIELHGSMAKGSCIDCGNQMVRDQIDRLLTHSSVPKCECGGIIKPDVVFFGEQLPQQALAKGIQMASRADLMIVMGSSLVVYPAATLPAMTHYNGGELMIINKGRTGLDSIAHMKCEVDLVEFSREVIELI
jgi:NAD-dependent deacetylase